METRLCKTCGSPIVGHYCPACGQRHREARITVRYIGIELFQLVTNVERGLWYTIICLVKNPGKVIRDYLGGATALYYQPFRFLLLAAGTSALLASFVDYDKIVDMAMSAGGIQITPEAKAAQSKTMQSLLRYTTALISLSVPLSSVGTFLAYRKYRNTYAEHMVANAYLYGFLSFLSIFTTWFMANPNTYLGATIFSNFAMLICNVWFYKSWYQIKWRQAFWRSLLTLFIVLSITIIIGNIIVIILMQFGLMPKPY